ncbi:MAG TPA: HAD hydrolase-like protein [Ferruginibacter sp.]|nr:HAD hydrolase-like protein [Ferruginibacter sp.]
MAVNIITTLFLDIGGVLLTNGWDRTARKLAAEKFNLDLNELNESHHLIFNDYETGKLTLDEYLNRLNFHNKIFFPKAAFKEFIFKQSKPYNNTIAFFKALKIKHRLKVVAVNNEGRELNEYRINKFKLDELFDAFVSSCYVKTRKSDPDIFCIACDIAHSQPKETIMIDDRSMFTEVAKTVGITAIQYEGLDSIKEKLKLVNFKPAFEQ